MTELVKVTQGVWRTPDEIAELAGRAAAVLQVCPPGTVVCGLTAARLHGLWLPPSSAGEPIDVIVHRELPRPSARCGSRRVAVRARRCMVAADEVSYLDGLPILTEARVWVELAESLRMPDLIAAGDSSLRGDATLAELQETVRRARHRPGVVRARAALPLLEARSRSRPESHLRYALVGSGLPTPEVNMAIHAADGSWLAEPDLSYDDVRLAIEYNGADHARPARMRRDITRELDVVDGGWLSVTFGPVQVFRRPDQAAALVRQLRHERGGGR